MEDIYNTVHTLKDRKIVNEYDLKACMDRQTDG